MQINWVTFVAEIINLLVLVWLLKRFLYAPITAIISKRQAEINEKIESANNLHRQAESEFQTLELEKNAFEKSLQVRQNDLTKELNQQRKETLMKIKQEASQLKRQLNSEIQLQNESLKSELEEFISHDFLKIAGQIITDLTDATPMERVLNLFYKRLVRLTNNEKLKINKTLKNQKVITINSSAALLEKHKKDMGQFLRSYFEIPPKTKIQYNVSSDLILGIEIRIQDIGIDWTIKNYLDELQQDLDKLLNHRG